MGRSGRGGGVDKWQQHVLHHILLRGHNPPTWENRLAPLVQGNLYSIGLLFLYFTGAFWSYGGKGKERQDSLIAIIVPREEKNLKMPLGLGMAHILSFQYPINKMLMN